MMFDSDIYHSGYVHLWTHITEGNPQPSGGGKRKRKDGSTISLMKDVLSSSSRLRYKSRRGSRHIYTSSAS
jgi:hypothetical protein